MDGYYRSDYLKRLHRYSILALPLAFMGLVLVLDVTSFSQIQKSDAFALIGSIFNAGVLSLKKLRDQYNTVAIGILDVLFVSIFVGTSQFRTFYVNTNHN